MIKGPIFLSVQHTLALILSAIPPVTFSVMHNVKYMYIEVCRQVLTQHDRQHKIDTAGRFKVSHFDTMEKKVLKNNTE